MQPVTKEKAAKLRAARDADRRREVMAVVDEGVDLYGYALSCDEFVARMPLPYQAEVFAFLRGWI